MCDSSKTDRKRNNPAKFTNREDREAAARNLELLINENRMSTRDFANLIKSTKQTVNRWLSAEATMPIDYGLLISKKYHVSLDWLYGLKDNSDIEAIKETDDEKYIVDIRDCFSISDDTMKITVSSGNYDYIRNRNEIEKSVITESERKNRLNELKEKTNREEPTYDIWCITIPIAELRHYIKYDNDSKSYINDEDMDDMSPPTKNEENAAIEFLKLLNNDSRNEK